MSTRLLPVVFASVLLLTACGSQVDPEATATVTATVTVQAQASERADAETPKTETEIDPNPVGDPAATTDVPDVEDWGSGFVVGGEPSYYEPNYDLLWTEFGKSGYFITDRSGNLAWPRQAEEPSDVIVTVGNPTVAECPQTCYATEIGDRVVSVPLTVKNNSARSVRVDSDAFRMLLPNGEQVRHFEGSARDYRDQSDFDADYEEIPEVPSGETFEGRLVFESTGGEQTIMVLLDDNWMMHVWTGNL